MAGLVMGALGVAPRRKNAMRRIPYVLYAKKGEWSAFGEIRL